MCLCPDLLVGNFAANGELPEKQAGLELMCQLNSNEPTLKHLLPERGAIK